MKFFYFYFNYFLNDIINFIGHDQFIMMCDNKYNSTY